MVNWLYFSFDRNIFRGEIILKFLYNYNYLIYGLGQANQAVSDYFNKQGINYQIYIDKGEEVTSKILDKIDIIVKSPGIPFDTPLLKLAKELKVKVIGDLELFYLFNPESEIICVTGTNGKTTTCYLIYELLKKKYQVFLAGNIGIPLFSIIDKAINKLVVIEASSYMLASTEQFHPHLVVYLNFYPNHLSMHYTFSNYVKAKLKSMSNLEPNDIIIYNQDDYLIKQMIEKNNSIKISFSTKTNVNSYNLNLEEIVLLKGRHNLENTKAALAVAKYYDITEADVTNVLTTFNALEHRIEKIYEDDKLIIFNDSKATNGLATKEAILTVSKNENSSIIWIGGGQERHEQYDSLNEAINNINFAYLYGANKNSLSLYLTSLNIKHLIFNNLEEVVNSLPTKFNQKTIILFSPATPSHDQYHSFEERGSHFKNLISNHFLKKIQFKINK